MATRSLNQVFLMGNLTRDPELRQISTGSQVCSFSIALNRSIKDQAGNYQEAVDYVDVVAWGPMGERVAQYMAKGRKVLVQGELRSSSWEQDGKKRTKLEVNAINVTFLDSRGGDDGSDGGNGGSSYGGQSGSSSASSSKKKDTVIEDVGDEPINLDDIPF